MLNKTNITRTLCVSLIVLGLGACSSVGPQYTAPAVITPQQTWQAALPHDGQQQGLIDWWAQLKRPALTQLQEAADANNPTLAIALARIAEARAGVSSAEAGRQVSVNSSAVAQRSGNIQTGAREQSYVGVSADAGWEVDLFGSVRRGNEAAQARLDARTADWHYAKVSMAAEVANLYVNWTSCQQVLGLYNRVAESKQETARLTQLRVNAGFTAKSDAHLASASVADSLSAIKAQNAQCQLYVKSLVTLTGLNEAKVREILATHDANLPDFTPFAVSSVPVQLLRQRPDLAAAERDLAAASADIGSAEANRYPRLALSGQLSLGLSLAGGSTTTTMPWSFGPSLSLPLLDGGRRKAAVSAAEARYAQSLGRYQQSVNQAVEEVERSLVLLDSVSQRKASVQTSLNDYQAFFKSTEAAWKAGSASLLNVEDARRASTNAQLNQMQLERDTQLSWIALYKALGGGWKAAQ